MFEKIFSIFKKEEITNFPQQTTFNDDDMTVEEEDGE